MSNKIDRTGEESYNNFGTLMKIIEYKNNKQVLIEFQDEYKYRTYVKYLDFQRGFVRNPYDRCIAGIGFMGVGESYKDNINAYHVWNDMITRCYDSNCSSYLNYYDCTVCEEWHNFQNFVQWYNFNFYQVPNERMHLDKDILYKGNRLYSPETCVFVPAGINTIFTHKKQKSTDLPVGCFYNHGKIQVVCRTYYKQVIVGRFELDDIEAAFNAYKDFKENYIKQLAEDYRYIIPDNLYHALLQYEIDIND